jgi:hypothetical protein
LLAHDSHRSGDVLSHQSSAAPNSINVSRHLDAVFAFVVVQCCWVSGVDLAVGVRSPPPQVVGVHHDADGSPTRPWRPPDA